MTDNDQRPGSSDEVDGPYRFTGLVATSWRFYMERFWPLFAIFVVIAAVNMALPYVLLIEMPDTVALMVALFVRFSLPAMIGSYGFAVIAVIQDHNLNDDNIGARPAMRKLRPGWRNVMATAMISGIIGLAAVTFFGVLGALLLPLFYGPPMLMQVISLEGLTLAEGWTRTRAMMRGHWTRVITYLLSISLGIGILGYTAISTTLAATESTPQVLEAVAFIAITLLVIGVTFPYLATAQFIAFADIASLEQRPAGTSRSGGRTSSTGERPALPPTAETATHYEVLGVRRSANQRQIRRAYETRMKLLDASRHPDADAEMIVHLAQARTRTQEAYDTLGDPDRRAVYDATLQG